MSTKLQEYKRASNPVGHKNIRARKTTTLSFHEWLRPKNYHALAATGPKVAYAHKLINDVNIPHAHAVSEALSL